MDVFTHALLGAEVAYAATPRRARLSTRERLLLGGVAAVFPDIDGERPELRALVEQLWEEPRFAPFRRFATYPSVSRIDSNGRETCVWFTDLRYDLPALPDTFRYGFCRDSVEQPWQLYRLRYFSERSRQRLSP